MQSILLFVIFNKGVYASPEGLNDKGIKPNLRPGSKARKTISRAGLKRDGKSWSQQYILYTYIPV